MRFWDSSALVPLLVEEERSPACRSLYRASPTVHVWALTRTEIVSAIHRRERAEQLTAPDRVRAIARLDLLAKRWREVDGVLAVRNRAERLLASHPLHAADSLQLAAAIVLVDDRPRDHFFVTADEVLARAAEREGFKVDEPA